MLNKMKLAPKLALVIGSVLKLVLIVLISITAVMSKSAISASTYSELAAISETNGLEIQQIFDAAETVAVNIEYYMERAYKTVQATSIPKCETQRPGGNGAVQK